MQEQAVSSTKPHELTLRGREALSLSGVEDVLRFDEAAIVCRTTLGDLIIEGSSLRIFGFSAESGALSVGGTVNAFYYEEKRERGRGARLLNRGRL